MHLKNGLKVFEVTYAYIIFLNKFLGIESSRGGYNVHNNIEKFFFFEKFKKRFRNKVLQMD